MWERPARAGAPPVEAVDYPHELPRYLHAAGGDSLLVTTPAEADEALASGFYVNPNDIPADEANDDVVEGDEPPAAKPRKSRKAKGE